MPRLVTRPPDLPEIFVDLCEGVLNEIVGSLLPKSFGTLRVLTHQDDFRPDFELTIKGSKDNLHLVRRILAEGKYNLETTGDGKVAIRGKLPVTKPSPYRSQITAACCQVMNRGDLLFEWSGS